MKQTVIQSLSIFMRHGVVQVEVGEETCGRGVIEIKQVGYDSHSEFQIIGEDEELIASIEGIDNTPVMIEWKTIVVEDDETFNYEVSGDLPF